MATPPETRLSYGSLFRYSTPKERRVIALGCLASAVTGPLPNPAVSRPPRRCHPSPRLCCVSPMHSITL